MLSPWAGGGPMLALQAKQQQNVIIFVIFYCPSMRDDHYSQKLHQIREKYGYFNDRTALENFRQPSCRRQLLPPAPRQPLSNTYTHNCQNWQRQTYKEGWMDGQLSARQQKENYPIPALTAIRNPQDKPFPQKQPFLQEDFDKSSIERPRSQRPSFNQPNQHSDLSHMQSSFHESSSPIRKLHMDLSSQNTPRHHHAQHTQRSPTATPQRVNKSIQRVERGFAERSPFRQAPQPALPYEPMKRTLERVPTTPDRNDKGYKFGRQETVNPQMQKQPCNSCPQDSKSSLDLVKIEKIQQRIQAALNKNKK